MAELQYRFTLTNSVQGSLQISEPMGWTNIELTVERHPEYHSLIETFEIPIGLYGSDGTNNGGYDFFKSCLAQGLNTEIEIRIEVKEGSGSYEDLFVGQLQVHLYTDFPAMKKLQVPVIRNNLWAKFINRIDFPIDLKSTVSVDGATVTARNEFDLDLPSQIIRQVYRGDHFDTIDYPTTTTGGFIYGIIDFEDQSLNEIADKFNYPQVASNSLPIELFTMKYGGEYSFDSSITLTTDTITWGFPVNSDVYFQINNETPIAFTRTDLGTPGVDGRTKFTYNDTHTLDKGDQIRVYIESADACSWPGSADTNFLEVIGNTVDLDSTTPAYFAHDAGLCIVDRLVSENNAFYSEYFGNSQTAITYGNDGCGSPHAIMKGLHVRGYTIASRPFRLSFKEWWEGLNPIFGLGLGYEAMDSTPDSEVIRVEKLEDFYDNTSNSVQLDNVDGELIEFSTDEDIIFKKVKTGYTKWEAESASGIDDPQTKHDYTAKMRIVGGDKPLLSNFYAASLGIEQTRRNRVDQSRDWRLDEDTMIIQLTWNTPPEVATYLDGDFTNLNNGGSRYNVRLDPYMSMRRWINYLGIGLEATAIDEYEFAGGEGNVLMQFTDATANDCEQPFNSNDNVGVDVSPSTVVHSATLASFSHPLTYTQYKAIIADRKKSIGFSYVDKYGATQSFTAHIKKMKYAINTGMANFELWTV